MGALIEVNNLVEKLKKLSKEIEITKTRVLDSVAKECAKYENKKINYISKSPRIFTIKFSDLENNWSPDYYDYEHQFKAILYVLQHTKADNLVDKWQKIRTKGIAMFLSTIVKEYNLENPFSELNEELSRDWYRSSYTIIKFHPEVVKFMDNLLLG